MEVTELTKEIHDKYPKVYMKIFKYIFSNNDFIYLKGGVYSNISYNCYYIYNECHEYKLLPFSMLYGLLEDFFWKEYNIKLKDILYNILKYTNRPDNFYHYKKCQQQSILKACEILENKLKE